MQAIEAIVSVFQVINFMEFCEAEKKHNTLIKTELNYIRPNPRLSLNQEYTRSRRLAKIAKNTYTRSHNQGSAKLKGIRDRVVLCYLMYSC